MSKVLDGLFWNLHSLPFPPLPHETEILKIICTETLTPEITSPLYSCFHSDISFQVHPILHCTRLWLWALHDQWRSWTASVSNFGRIAITRCSIWAIASRAVSAILIYSSFRSDVSFERSWNEFRLQGRKQRRRQWPSSKWCPYSLQGQPLGIEQMSRK